MIEFIKIKKVCSTKHISRLTKNNIIIQTSCLINMFNKIINKSVIGGNWIYDFMEMYVYKVI